MIVRLAGISIVALAAAPLHAQQVAEADTQEIVVTAQLREQNPIEVPIALSATTGETLGRLGLEDFERFSRFVPGFAVQNQAPNNPGFVLRGITSDSGTAFNEPRVSVFQDGVSISKSRGSYVELFDMERVEVARGPQTTLYGRGALIGAVNLIQNKADPSSYAAMARASYGNFDATILEGMANLPLGEGIAARVAGRYRKRDGTVENLLGGADFNSIDTGAVRGSFHVGSGALTFDLIGNYQKDTPAGTSFKSISLRPTDPATGAVIGDAGRNSGAALALGQGFEGGRRLGGDREVWGVTGIATWELDGRFELTSITAYREFDTFEAFDADGISLPLLTAAEGTHGDQTSQELRLAYEDGPISAFIGASYFHERGSQSAPTQFYERQLLPQLTGTLSGPIPGRPRTDPAPSALFNSTAFTGALLQGLAGASGVLLPAAQAQAIAANLNPLYRETSTNFSRTEAFDLFGDVTWRIGERLELGAGLRYTHDDKRTGYVAAVTNGRSVLGGVLAALAQPAPIRNALLGALAVPGAANIPPSAAFPVPLFGLGIQPTSANGGRDDADLSDDGLSWRFTVRYAASDEVSLYANYARGRRPRVLSANAPAAPFGATQFDVLPNERVDSWEAGIKTALNGRTLFVDGSLFYYKYDNFQSIVQQGTQFVITNAGRAESYGFESQLRWVPSDVATLFATYTYNHSRFGSGLRDGNRFRLSPDHMGAIGLILDYPLGPGTISFAPTITWQSRVYFDDDNDRSDLQQRPNALVPDNIRDETQKGYALVNARLGYQLNGWLIEGFVDNLFDADYIRDAGNTGDALGLATFIAGDPRTYGISATVRFGGGR